MKNLIRDTLKKIEKQHIAPEPRWIFLVKKYGLWVFFGIILTSTALAFSVVIDNARNLDWDLYHFMHQSRLRYFLSMIPYFWIILIVIFLAAAFFEIRRTETGYRYSWPKILLITVGGIAILGLFMASLDFGSRLNSKLTQDVPFYSRHMVVTKESQWMQPSKGFLAGAITSVSEERLGIEDLNGDEWKIVIDENTSVRPSVNVSQGEMIKIIGIQTGENDFKAKEIRPWVGKGMGSGRNGGPMNGGRHREDKGQGN